MGEIRQLHSFRIRQKFAISFALITVATPARVSYTMVLALQLRGPFSAAVRAGFHRLLLSVPPGRRLLVLVYVFMYWMYYNN
jgi:hypothetical protein